MNFVNIIKTHKLASAIIGFLIVFLLGSFWYVRYENQNIKPTDTKQLNSMIDDIKDKDTILYIYNSEKKSNNKYKKEISEGEKYWEAHNPDGQIINVDLSDSNTRHILEGNSYTSANLTDVESMSPWLSLSHKGNDVATISFKVKDTTNSPLTSSNIKKLFHYDTNNEKQNLHSKMDKK